MSVEPTAPDHAADAPLDLGGGALVPGWLQRLAALGWRVLVSVAMGIVLVTVGGPAAGRHRLDPVRIHRRRHRRAALPPHAGAGLDAHQGLGRGQCRRARHGGVGGRPRRRCVRALSRRARPRRRARGPGPAGGPGVRRRAAAGGQPPGLGRRRIRGLAGDRSPAGHRADREPGDDLHPRRVPDLLPAGGRRQGMADLPARARRLARSRAHAPGRARLRSDRRIPPRNGRHRRDRRHHRLAVPDRPRRPPGDAPRGRGLPRRVRALPRPGHRRRRRAFGDRWPRRARPPPPSSSS